MSGGVGYFANNYFNNNYWADNYWSGPSSGAIEISKNALLNISLRDIKIELSHRNIQLVISVRNIDNDIN